MVSFTEQCAVLFLSISFSFLMISSVEVSPEKPSDGKDSVILEKQVLPSNLSSTDVNLADFLPKDATEGTTPDICPTGATCAFQHFLTVRGEVEYYPPYVYCNCPGDQVCIEVGINNRRCFFYYGCRNSTPAVSSTTEAGIRNASVSLLGVSATSMMPQNAASEPGEPIPFKFEGEIPLPSNC